jgi:hypothetical protein
MAGWSKFKSTGQEAGPAVGVDVPGPELAWAKRNAAQQLAKTGQAAFAVKLLREAVDIKGRYHQDERHPALLEDLLVLETFYANEGAGLEGAADERLKVAANIVRCLESIAQAAESRPRGGSAALIEAEVVRGAAMLRWGLMMSESEELEDALTLVVLGQARAAKLSPEEEAEVHSRVAQDGVVERLAEAFADVIESRRSMRS